MTQDEIIDMADKADEEADNVLNMKGEYHPNWHQVRDEAFAKLVAEREREGCVEIAESKRHAPHFVLTSMPSQNGTAVDIANLIRARGQA
jgi:hypothetical protein